MNRRLSLDKLESRRLLAGDILTVNYYHPSLDAPVVIADNQPAGVEIEGRGTTTAADLNPNIGTLTSILPVPEVDLVFATGDASVASSSVTVAAPTLEAIDPFSPILSAGFASLGDGITESEFGAIYDDPATPFIDRVMVNGVVAGVEVEIDGETFVTTDSDTNQLDWIMASYGGLADGQRGFVQAYDISRLFGSDESTNVDDVFSAVNGNFSDPFVESIIALV